MHNQSKSKPNQMTQNQVAHSRRVMRLCFCMVLLAMTMLAGCEPVNYVLFAFEDDRIPAQYKLVEKASVVVLVDDPEHHLGSSALPSLVAAWATESLNKNLKKTTAVAVADVVELSRKVGEDFKNMPVDQVGSEVGATQVIYVLVESAGITGDPGLYRPQAVVRVNVIDVATGSRLFPYTDQINPEATQKQSGQRGVAVEVKLPFTTSDQSPIGETAVLMQKLAEKIGVNVAQVFYKHHPDPVPGYSD